MADGKPLYKKFIGYWGEYTFPVEQLQTNDNFGNVKTRTTALAGLDGGFDELGDRRAPQEIGNLQFTYKLVNGWQDKTVRVLRDEARRMIGWGAQLLFALPADLNDFARQVRWTRARVTSLVANQRASDHPDVYQDVQVQFNTPDPGWYGFEASPAEPAYNAGGWYYFNDGLTFDTAGLVWGGARVNAVVDGGDSLTATNSGTRPTRPVIRIEASAVMSGFGLRRLNAYGQVLDEWRYTGELAVGDVLVVNCQTLSVVQETVRGDEEAYNAFEVVRGIGFHELVPGANTFELTGTFTDATVTFDFFDSWY